MKRVRAYKVMPKRTVMAIILYFLRLLPREVKVRVVSRTGNVFRDTARVGEMYVLKRGRDIELVESPLSRHYVMVRWRG